MKKVIFLMPLLLVMLTLPTYATNLKGKLKGKWTVQKIETTDQSLNAMINESEKEIAKIIVELTEEGTIKVSDTDTKTKYKVEGDKIIFSEGIAKEIKNPEVNATLKSQLLTVQVPAELVKQIMLISKDLYVKAGGDTFIASLIESAALTYEIKGTIILKRK